MNTYIALGSNMADPLSQVCLAIDEIAHIQHFSLLARSRIYKSSPMETANNILQNDFINAVVLLETQLCPDDLFCELQKIENNHNRERIEPRWGPRTLDLDILLYGNQIINTENLTIPHSGIAERDFVLVPLADIEPNLFIPNLGHISDLIKKCRSYDLEEIKPLSLP